MFRPLSLLLVVCAVLALALPASAGFTFQPKVPFQLLKPNIVLESIYVFEHGDVVSVPYAMMKLRDLLQVAPLPRGSRAASRPAPPLTPPGGAPRRAWPRAEA